MVQRKCEADPKRIQQMLMNLVLNGIQAQHDIGGTVHIELSPGTMSCT